MVVAPAPAAATVEQMARAGIAFREGRLFDPPGDSALEHYAAVVAAEPDNSAAREALTDLFPLALSRVEAMIAAGNAAEARRIIGILEVAYPGSTAIASLRPKLDGAAAAPASAPTLAQPVAPPELGSRVVEPVQAPAIDAPAVRSEMASVEPSQRQPAPSPAPESPPSAPPTPVDPEPVAVIPPEPTPQVAQSQTADAAPPRTDSPVVTRPPRVVERVPPDYPAVARQRRLEGWVELEYVVDADGRVVDVRVLGSHPTRVFEAPAERALRRWRFEPATRDGVPERAVGRTRIDFTLG